MESARTPASDEPEPLLNYKARHAEFPHETTADQFFDDAQFESYRALGFTIMKRVHDAAVRRHNQGRPTEDRIQDFENLTLLEFFQMLEMSEGGPEPPVRPA